MFSIVLQGGPHENAIAAVAVALKEAMRPEFTAYIRQVTFSIVFFCVMFWFVLIYWNELGQIECFEIGCSIDRLTKPMIIIQI